MSLEIAKNWGNTQAVVIHYRRSRPERDLDTKAFPCAHFDVRSLHPPAKDSNIVTTTDHCSVSPTLSEDLQQVLGAVYSAWGVCGSKIVEQDGMEQWFRRQIPHNTNRNQQRETVATSTTFRSNVGSAKPRVVFFPSGPQSRTSNNITLRLFKKHTPQALTAPKRREAWTPRHASRAGKPLRMSSLPRPFSTHWRE